MCFQPHPNDGDEKEIKRQIISCEIPLLTEVACISVASIICCFVDYCLLVLFVYCMLNNFDKSASIICS